jgi:outer membrane protein
MSMTGGTTMRRAVRAGACALALMAAAAAARAETLTDTLISAYLNSNLIEQNRAVLRAADEDVAIALSALRPTLDFFARYDWNDSAATRNVGTDNLQATMGLVAELVILDAGQRGLSLDLQKEAVLATREALVAVEQDVLLEAIESFFDVAAAQAFVEIRVNNVRLVQEELQAARDRFEVGEVTRTDVALAESRLAEARSLLAAARGDLAVARERFRAAVGRYPDGPVVVPSTLPETAATVDDAVAISVRRHPSIRQSQREVTVREIAAEIAGRAYGPTLRLSGRVQAQTDTGGIGATGEPDPGTGVNDSSSIGLELRQPIYSGGRLPAVERQALAQRDQARANLHQTTLGIRRNVGAAWARVEVSRVQISATEEQIRAAEIAFEGTREEARLGARTTLDVLDAEQDLLDARGARIDAIATQYVAIYSLLSAMGLLTVDHLGLGVQTYDPVAYYNAVRNAPARSTRQGEALDRVLRSIGRD